jgi:uncharacterized membrane protein YoaK (UPF0700 family)
MYGKTPLSTHGKQWVAAILTCVAGFVDVVGYITLSEIFTANMSGNSIHIGQFLVDRNTQIVLAPAIAVFSYVTALIATRIIIEIGARHHLESIATWTLLLEFVLLITAVLAGDPFVHNGLIAPSSSMRLLVAALLAFAMGSQNATLTKVGPLTVYTTFVTGTLTKFAQRLSMWTFRVYDQGRFSFKSQIADADFRESVFLLSIWISYVVGATIGAIFRKRLELEALLIPTMVIFALILLDQIRPMSLEEERE